MKKIIKSLEFLETSNSKLENSYVKCRHSQSKEKIILVPIRSKPNKNCGVRLAKKKLQNIKEHKR